MHPLSRKIPYESDLNQDTNQGAKATVCGLEGRNCEDNNNFGGHERVSPSPSEFRRGLLAQLNRVPHYGCGGCRFESCIGHEERCTCISLFLCIYLVRRHHQGTLTKQRDRETIVLSPHSQTPPKKSEDFENPVEKLHNGHKNARRKRRKRRKRRYCIAGTNTDRNNKDANAPKWT